MREIMDEQILEGNTTDSSFKIGIVVSKWNSFITDELLQGARSTFTNHGFSDAQIVVACCPGAYEIPYTTKKLLPKVDGIVTLGSVIRGDTPHFDYVCNAVNRGVVDLNMKGNKPVVFGVLTTDDVQQAQERCGLKGDKGNKGSETALALMKMLTLSQKIDEL